MYNETILTLMSLCVTGTLDIQLQNECQNKKKFSSQLSLQALIISSGYVANSNVWPCSTYMKNEWSDRMYSKVLMFQPIYHVSVSPTDGNGPTQGQRKTLTRVRVPPWSEFSSVLVWAHFRVRVPPWSEFSSVLVWAHFHL